MRKMEEHNRKLLKDRLGAIIIGGTLFATGMYESRILDISSLEEFESDRAVALHGDHLPHTHSPDFSPGPDEEYVSVSSGSSYDFSAGSGSQVYIPDARGHIEWV